MSSQPASRWRLLYFADIRFPLERANGIQTMETCYALAERGHAVHLIVRPDRDTPSRNPFEYYGLAPRRRLTIERVHVAGPVAARRAGYLAHALGRALGATRADAVLTRDLGVASALLYVTRSLRPPMVYESHGYAPDVSLALPDLVATARPSNNLKLKRLARREARVWRRADAYITITQALADDLSARFGERKQLAIIPDGVRRPAAAPAMPKRRPLDGANPVVAYAGHLYPWKGVDVLLAALARLPNARGLIVGGHDREGDLGRLQGLARERGLTDRVTFTGLVRPSDVPALLAGAAVLVLPNPASAIATRFTSPLKLFEYMAAGRPIVASDLPAIREVLQHDVNALLAAPGDSEALAAAIQRVLDDPALGDRLARAAADGALEYTWDRRAERIESLLDQIVQPSR